MKQNEVTILAKKRNPNVKLVRMRLNTDETMRKKITGLNNYCPFFIMIDNELLITIVRISQEEQHLCDTKQVRFSQWGRHLCDTKQVRLSQ